VATRSKPRIAALLLWLVLACRPLAAAPADYEGLPILSVQLVPRAGQPLPLPADLALKPGSVYRAADARAAIERLFLSGRYATIAIDVTSAGAGLAVRILTDHTEFIGRVSAEGVSDAPIAAQIENSTKLDLGTPFSEDRVTAALTSIQSVLRDNGYYQAAVTPRFERVPEYSEVNITFQVELGPRARYEQPLIGGESGKAAEKLLNASRWRRWSVLPGFKQVTQARTQGGLERMRNSYHKQKRLMARVTLEDLEYHPVTNTLTPTVLADRGPKVEVKVDGARISHSRLKDLVPVFEEQSVDNDLLYEGERNLEQYLQSQGYFDARISHRRDAEAPSGPSRPANLQITFQADRGDRSKLVAVRIEGNRYFDTRTIRERMFLLPARLLSYRHGRFSQQYLERDKDSILNLYRANGFLDAKIDAVVDPSWTNRAGRVGVRIRITEGPQSFVEKLEIAGVSPALLADVSGLLLSLEGQPFSELNLSTDRDNILNYYYDHGYPDVQVETTFQKAGAQRLNVRYAVREGQRQFVRDVVIGGLNTTNYALVADRISLSPGEPLSRSAMVESQRRLYDLGIFAKVSTAIQNPDGLESEKYVLYQMEEARRWAFSFGFGAEIARIGGGGTTDLTQPSGGAGFSPRGSFGVTRYNLFGAGHSLGLQTQVSTILKRGVLTYQAPQFKGDDRFNLSFSALVDDSKNVRTFSSQRVEGSAQLGQRLSKASSLQYRLTYRRVSVDKDTLNITPQLIPLLSQPVRIGMVSSTFIQDRRDDPIESTRGIYNTLDVGVATRGLASQSSFFRLLGKNSTYYKVGDAIIARSITFGWINNFGSGEIPLPERFFSGGGSTHRGFPDNQAGPRDLTTGFPLGGTATLQHQLEYRFPLSGENIHGVFFHDMGNVFSSLDALSFRVKQRNLQDFDYMEHAVGFGVRYKTPIGPVRLDLAYSMNPPSFVGFKGTRDQLLFCGGPNPPTSVNCTGVYNVRQQLSHFQFHFSLGQTF
jgi:outer membrane protein assembly complex protein YaeT